MSYGRFHNCDGTSRPKYIFRINISICKPQLHYNNVYVSPHTWMYNANMNMIFIVVALLLYYTYIRLSGISTCMSSGQPQRVCVVFCEYISHIKGTFYGNSHLLNGKRLYDPRSQ